MLRKKWYICIPQWSSASYWNLHPWNQQYPHWNQSIIWMLMALWHKEPGHQQPRHWTNVALNILVSEPKRLITVQEINWKIYEIVKKCLWLYRGNLSTAYQILLKIFLFGERTSCKTLFLVKTKLNEITISSLRLSDVMHVFVMHVFVCNPGDHWFR